MDAANCAAVLLSVPISYHFLRLYSSTGRACRRKWRYIKYTPLPFLVWLLLLVKSIWNEPESGVMIRGVSILILYLGISSSVQQQGHNVLMSLMSGQLQRRFVLSFCIHLSIKLDVHHRQRNSVFLTDCSWAFLLTSRAIHKVTAPIIWLKQYSCPRGSSRANLQVLVLVRGPQSPRKVSRTSHSANSLLCMIT